MAKSLHSQAWFRVAAMKPRLKAHVALHRHRYRGRTWYVVQDAQTGKHYRLSPAAHQMAVRMTGTRTMQELWEDCLRWIGEGEEPPTQDETIRLLVQLYQGDLLVGDVPPDVAELAHRARDRETKALMSRLKNPLALRLPLWDPDRFLTATLPLFGWLFSWFGLAIWLAVVASGVAIAARHWGELTGGLADRVFLAQNLLGLALVYPLVKALHELGHGYAVKRWGGEVREVGLMFLVLLPVPYVDASSSISLDSKWRRAVVSGAGIMVEMLLAGLAMIVWVNAEPGLVRAAAFNVALIGGVSTLLFNGNPLLRFDGYYVLADLAEMPNLGSRANRQVFYLIQSRAFGMEEARPGATSPGEGPWLVLYAVLAFVYRVFLTLSIALFIAGKLFFIGIGLALWAVVNAFVLPLAKGLWWLVDAPALRGHRGRAVAVTAATLGALFLTVSAIPLPYATRLEGVVTLPEEAILRSAASGTVLALGADGPVRAGETLLRLEDPSLVARREVARAQRAELAVRLAAANAQDPVQVALLQEQIGHADETLARLDEDLAGLTLTARRDARFVAAGPLDLTGSYMPKGRLVGYLLRPEDPTVVVAVPQARADLVAERVDGVEAVTVDRPHAPMAAEIVQRTPQPARVLPSPVLGTEGGGRIPLDPEAGDPTRAFDAHVLVTLRVGDGETALPVGQRVLVRFDHGTEPLARRLMRGLRQVFLARFDV